ncbi:MAG TPA: dynamin family protein [Polyangiaceae bacterium]
MTELPSESFRRIKDIAVACERHDLATEADALDERIAEGRFFLACLGQFKRGKSSVLNALVGERLLPVGVVPVTAIVTVVRHGARIAARVRIGDDASRDVALEDLAAYVSEAQNPDNAKNVTGVEVFHPSSLLATGLCLVDTPGLGSVFASNTAATRSFVPHVDAALIVVGADPPISGEELDLAVEVAKQTPAITFALNKADRLASDEVAEAKRFTVDVLRDRLDVAFDLFEVSAREKLETNASTRDFAALESRLRTLAEGGRSGLVRSAAIRGARRLCALLIRDLDERRAALLRPREESVRRIEALQIAIAAAERELDDMTYLFDAVQDRLRRRLEEERRAFLNGALVDTRTEVTARVTTARERRDLPAFAMEQAREVGRSSIETWRNGISSRIERETSEASARFVDLARQFLETVSASDDPALATLRDSFAPDLGFTAKPQYWFNDLLTVGDASIVTRITSSLRTPEARVEAALRGALPYLDRLLETNSQRVTNDFIEQAFESRRRLGFALRRHLREAISATEESLARAERVVAAGKSAVDTTLASLDRSRRALDTVVAGLEFGP